MASFWGLRGDLTGFRAGMVRGYGRVVEPFSKRCFFGKREVGGMWEACGRESEGKWRGGRGGGSPAAGRGGGGLACGGTQPTPGDGGEGLTRSAKPEAGGEGWRGGSEGEGGDAVGCVGVS